MMVHFLKKKTAIEALSILALLFSVFAISVEAFSLELYTQDFSSKNLSKFETEKNESSETLNVVSDIEIEIEDNDSKVGAIVGSRYKSLDQFSAEMLSVFYAKDKEEQKLFLLYHCWKAYLK